MKQFCCALVLALATMTSAALAQDSSAPARAIDQRHYIYIEGRGTVRVDADLTNIAITLSEKRQSPDDVTQVVADKIAQFRAALDKLGIPSAAIETTSFDFSKVYIIAKDKTGQPVSSIEDPERDKFDGYRSTYGARITVASTDKVGAILSSASVLGIEVDSVTFASSHEADYSQQARKLAADSARSEAELYAKSLGGTLGDLLNVKEGGGYDPETMGVIQDGGEADLAVTPGQPLISIAPGKLTFRADVAAKWELLSAKRD